MVFFFSPFRKFPRPGRPTSPWASPAPGFGASLPQKKSNDEGHVFSQLSARLAKRRPARKAHAANQQADGPPRSPSPPRPTPPRMSKLRPVANTPACPFWCFPRRGNVRAPQRAWAVVRGDTLPGRCRPGFLPGVGAAPVFIRTPALFPRRGDSFGRAFGMGRSRGPCPAGVAEIQFPFRPPKFYAPAIPPRPPKQLK